MERQVESTPAARRSSGPIAWLLDRVGNIWFGVTLLVIIFIYCSIGSAVPPIRQGALADWLGLEFLRFEKTEMEWFSWWPFQTLIVLFCVALITVTLRRIPLTVVNAGVWSIHTGIIVLCVSSMIYFGTKVEGDAIIYHTKALIMAPGVDAPVSMVVRPDASTDVRTPDNLYRVRVASLQPGYQPLTKGYDKTYAVTFAVQSMNPERTFSRMVLLGAPELTEDVLMTAEGPKRAVKETGSRLIDEGLQIQLGYDPAEYFYYAQQPPIRSASAVYARFLSDGDWTELRIQDLPHYYEWVSHRDEIGTEPGDAPPKVRLLDLDVDRPADAKEFDGVSFRVTDYLPYADLQTRWGDRGEFLHPKLRFRLQADGKGKGFELVAFDPERSRMHIEEIDFTIEFTWASGPELRTQLVRRPEPRVVVSVPSKNLRQEVPVRGLIDNHEEGVAIEGTDYRAVLVNLVPADVGGHANRAIALVRFKKGDDSFERMVMAGDASGGQDLGPDRRPAETLKDPDLHVEYLDPSPQRLLFVGGPDAAQVDVIFSRMDGTFYHRQARVGEPFALVDGQEPMVVDALHPYASVVPVIVPRSQRQSMSEVGKTRSLIRVEVTEGGRTQSVWLPFHQYPFPDAQRARPEPALALVYQPRELRLSDGRSLELMYSRWREKLPSPVALDRFVLETHPGGEDPSDFISLVRFDESAGWSDVLEVKSNHPQRHGDLWYFQAMWDPYAQAHTVLGVGNRNGVHGMLAGVIISIAGMVYAFYVKPTLIRRRKRAALAAAGIAEHEAVVPRQLKAKKKMKQPEVTHV